MKKILLFAYMLASSLSANTAIVRQYLNTRDLTQIAAILQAQPFLANQALSGGITPLHEIAAHTSFSQVFHQSETAPLAEVLLLSGANPLATDRDGNTPLHTAARAGNRGVAALLHLHGASSKTTNSAGQTPEAIVRAQLGRTTPALVGIDGEFRAVEALLRMTTPSPKVPG